MSLRKSLLLFFEMFLFLYPALVAASDQVSCPVCRYENECCHIYYGAIDNRYNQYSHVPFMNEQSDVWSIYHCRACRFTCLEKDLGEIYGKKYCWDYGPPCAEDIEYTRKVMESFDFSYYGDKYDGKDLPRYNQYEIMKKLYSKKFVKRYWEIGGIFGDEVSHIKMGFIIGLEYHRAGLLDKATEAFVDTYKELKNLMNRTNLRDKDKCILYLYSGSIKYFLDQPLGEVIADYEKGMTLTDDFRSYISHWELIMKNSFYHNSIFALGPFFDNPFRFVFKMRNIAFMRAFYISFDIFLLSILMFFVMMGMWFAVEKISLNRSYGQTRFLFIFITLPLTIGTTSFFFYKCHIHASFRSLLFIGGVWSLLFYFSKKIIHGKRIRNQSIKAILRPRYKGLFIATLLIPWALLFYTSPSIREEMVSLFWATRIFYDGGYEWAKAAFDSMIFFLWLSFGVYSIHFLFSFLPKKESPGLLYQTFSSAVSIYLFWHMTVIVRLQDFIKEDYLFALFIGTLWFVLFVLLEYQIVRPLTSRFPYLWRLGFHLDCAHWKMIKLAFFAYPVAFVISRARFDGEFLKLLLIYSAFWPIVFLLLFTLHFLMSKIFKESRSKLDYSILTTILSFIAIYLSLSFCDLPPSYPYTNDVLPFYIILGILWLSLYLQIKYRILNRPTESKPLPKFFQILLYNRLWSFVEFSIIWLPILYGIIWCNRAGYQYLSQFN